MAEMGDEWHYLIKRYSGLRLAFEKDMFPALQGMERYTRPREGLVIMQVYGRTDSPGIFCGLLIQHGDDRNRTERLRGRGHHASMGWSWAFQCRISEQ